MADNLNQKSIYVETDYDFEDEDPFIDEVETDDEVFIQHTKHTK